MQKKEIGIIGGGASGLMAAIAAADSVKGRPGGIVLLEKKDRVGKKLLATGNGKCNLTNLSFSVENPGCYYRSRNPELLSAFFARFGVENFIDLAAGKEDDLHGIFSRSMVLDLLHKVCQDGHRCFQTTVAVFWQFWCQGIEAVHKEQAFLLAEIGQKVFELFVFLWVQT